MCKNQKGFTLVELLVVVAIIGVLAAVAVPRMSGMTANAKKARIMADLKIIDDAMDVYCAQNGAYPPQAKVDSAHLLVTSGLLASAPVPPTGSIDTLPATLEYWTEDATNIATNDAWRAYVCRPNNMAPRWCLRYLRERGW